MSRKRTFQEGEENPYHAMAAEAQPNKRGRVIRVTDPEVEPIYARPQTIWKFTHIISMLQEKGNSFLLFLETILDPPAFDFYNSNRYSEDPHLLQETIFNPEIQKQIREKIVSDLFEFNQYLQSMNPWEKKYLLMINPKLITEVSNVIENPGSVYPFSKRIYQDLGASLNFTLLEILQDRLPEIFKSPTPQKQTDTEATSAAIMKHEGTFFA